MSGEPSPLVKWFKASYPQESGLAEEIAGRCEEILRTSDPEYLKEDLFLLSSVL